MTWRDPYLWPDVDILKNKAGIKTQEKLDEHESNFARLRTYSLSDDPIVGDFDLQHLCDIHRHVFQDIYEFAGQIRSINISKGNMFSDVSDIRRLSGYLFTQLQKENHLFNLTPSQFAERAALYFNAINAIHPFREGNGRTQRLFIEQLAKEAGHTLNLEAVSNAITMVNASKQGISTDFDGVVAFDTQRPTLFLEMFQKAINPAYVDIMQQARAALATKFQTPELVPFKDGKPMLTVQGTVLAKNGIYTAQLHDAKGWFAVHPNNYLLEPLQPGEKALVHYNQKGMGTVAHIEKALEPASSPLPTYNSEQAKPVTQLNTVYHGKFIHIDDNHIYQELGRNNVIKHEKTAFLQKPLPELGKFGIVKYENGQAQLISKSLDKNLDISR